MYSFLNGMNRSCIHTDVVLFFNTGVDIDHAQKKLLLLLSVIFVLSYRYIYDD